MDQAIQELELAIAYLELKAEEENVSEDSRSEIEALIDRLSGILDSI
jgi:hypothetical protein